MITKFKNDGNPKILITASHVIIINGDEILIDDSRSYKPVSISMADGKPVFEPAADQLHYVPWGINPFNNSIVTPSPTESVTWNSDQGEII